MQRIEYRSASAHERGSICRIEFFWNLKQEAFFPDGMGCEGALVEVAQGIYMSLTTVYFLA